MTHPQSNRKKLYHRSLGVLCAAAAMVFGPSLASCTDELEAPGQKYSEKISFGVSISDKWIEGRGRSESDTKREYPYEVVEMQNSAAGKPLYLHTDITAGFPERTASPAEERKGTSRGTVVTADDLTQFGVSAISYEGDWQPGLTPNYFHNRTATKYGVLVDPALWPAEGINLRFFAYWPKLRQENYTISSQSEAPAITVDVPEQNSNQEDLIVAYTKQYPSTMDRDVPLNFQHAMTAVKFICGEDMVSCTIKSIKLLGVHTKGTYKYNIGDTDADTKTLRQPGAWTLTGEKGMAYHEFDNREIKLVPGGSLEGEEITNINETFFMIPQTLPEGAKIELVIQQPGGEDEILTADISGKSWPQGYTVTYRVSYKDWTHKLIVETPRYFDYRGLVFEPDTSYYNIGTFTPKNEITITSAKFSHGDIEARDIPWTATFRDDSVKGTFSPTPPAWFRFPGSGNGSGLYDAEIAVKLDSTEVDIDSKLASTDLGGSKTAPNDLSLHNGKMCTANSYIVKGKGWFMFPAVYGNAIHEGNTNTKPLHTSVLTAAMQIFLRIL